VTGFAPDAKAGAGKIKIVGTTVEIRDMAPDAQRHLLWRQ
jgi:hypothetical protein